MAGLFSRLSDTAGDRFVAYSGTAGRHRALEHRDAGMAMAERRTPRPEGAPNVAPGARTGEPVFGGDDALGGELEPVQSHGVARRCVLVHHDADGVLSAGQIDRTQRLGHPAARRTGDGNRGGAGDIAAVDLPVILPACRGLRDARSEQVASSLCHLDRVLQELA